jgi:NAD-dependent dihydropyrimidine dehydrogenase PreA subunit
MKDDAYAVLTQKHGYPNSVRYRRILELLMNPQQANLVLDLPMPVEELAAKHGLTVDNVKAEIDTLFHKGVIFPKNFHTMESPRFARNPGQFHDSTQSIIENKWYSGEELKQLYKLWEDFCEEEWYKDRGATINSFEQPPCRIIPAYNAIKDLPGIQPYDDVREVFKAQNLIAVCSCSCRKRRDSVGKTCEHSQYINCIQFNRGAEYAITRGTGRQLTYDQAMALVDEIEEDGLVHQWSNSRTMSMTVFCSCCKDCCMIWHPMDVHKLDIGKYWAKSRFQAQIDKELCTGCKTCAQRCMFGAIEMIKVEGSKKMKAVINPEKCFGCGVCVLKCKKSALHMVTVRGPEFVPEI